jgi:hypothetical protein
MVKINKANLAVAGACDTTKGGRDYAKVIRFTQECTEACNGFVAVKVSNIQTSIEVDTLFPLVPFCLSKSDIKAIEGRVESTRLMVDRDSEKAFIDAVPYDISAVSYPDTYTIWPTDEPDARVVLNIAYLESILKVAKAVQSTKDRPKDITLSVWRDASKPVMIETMNDKTGQTMKAVQMPVRRDGVYLPKREEYKPEPQASSRISITISGINAPRKFFLDIE